MSKVTKVIIHWHEGIQLIEKETELDGIKEADEFLRRVANHMKPNSGYNKVKFTALFSDGEHYTGRYDVHSWADKQENPSGAISLLDHMQGHLSHAINLNPNSEHYREWMNKVNSITS